MSTVKTQNLREVLEAQGRRTAWVAEQIGIKYHTFTYNLLDAGRSTPQEREGLARVLGLTPEQIDAVLAETARRPGKGEAA